MPLAGLQDFGTHAGGRRADEYCRYCYVNGSFTDPGIGLQGMIDRCAEIMVQRHIMPEPAAHELMSQVLPGLRRWRKAGAASVR
jgi:hypothetical protein